MEPKSRQRRTITLGGRDFSVTEVDILDRKDALAEYTLGDGSVIRVAVPIMSVLRVDDTWDLEGKPVYIVVPQTAVSTMSAPDELMKK